MKSFKEILVIMLFFVSCTELKADDGYRLWLRYDIISEQKILIENLSSYIMGGKYA